MIRESKSTGIQCTHGFGSKSGPKIFDRILNLHGTIGSNYDYVGYQQLKYLYDINCIFSSNPWGDIIDRSGHTEYPYRVHVRNKWQTPLEQQHDIDLDECCRLRVQEITKQHNPPYNIFWSGGIDSTLLLVSFLKYVAHDNICVFLTKESIDENQYFFDKIIKKIKYNFLEQQTPTHGANITGECGDTIWATLDHSFFFNSPSKDFILKPWQQWFERQNKNKQFHEFCHEFFTRAGREIKTLLDARWWFYFLCKHQSKATAEQFYLNGDQLILIPFYESKTIECWAWYNLHRIIYKTHWNTYKMPAKEIIFKFDKNEDYKKNKSKDYSGGVINLVKSHCKNKQMVRPLFITDNLETPTLTISPFFSDKHYKEELFETYKHLFS